MNNSYDAELFCSFYPIMKDFVYHYISYQEIHNQMDSLPGDREFWVYTCDAHFKAAVISWTMIMGTDSNKTHWKKLFYDNCDRTAAFKKYLKDAHSISESTWSTLHKDILRFRNEFVAHKTTKFDYPVPSLKNGLIVLYALEEWIRIQIRPDYLEGEELSKHESIFRKDIKDTLSLILQ